MTPKTLTAAPHRVLTVIRWPIGGIRTYLLYNYPALIAAGYRFTLVGPADDSFRELCEEVKLWEGIEFIEAPMSGAKCHLRRTVRRVLGEGRHGLIHSHGLTAAVHAVLGNFRRGLPHVITSHDVIRPRQFPGLMGRLKLRVLGWLLSRSDALVTVSDDARLNHLEYFPALAHHGCKVMTILNGIDTGRFQCLPAADSPTLRSRLGIPQEAFLMGFLGRFMEQKGFLTLIRALERAVAAEGARRLHLLAVGSGDWLREYRAEIDHRPALAGRITFAEHTRDVTPILREIDLLVMPSLWEACPLLPMEAMCAGVPVLGSDCIGLREVLAGSPSMMVPAGDEEALSRGILRAAETLWRDLALEYAPLARQRFDVQGATQKLSTLFDQFVT